MCLFSLWCNRLTRKRGNTSNYVQSDILHGLISGVCSCPALVRNKWSRWAKTTTNHKWKIFFWLNTHVRCEGFWRSCHICSAWTCLSQRREFDACGGHTNSGALAQDANPVTQSRAMDTFLTKRHQDPLFLPWGLEGSELMGNTSCSVEI